MLSRISFCFANCCPFQLIGVGAKEDKLCECRAFFWPLFFQDTQFNRSWARFLKAIKFISRQIVSITIVICIVTITLNSFSLRSEKCSLGARRCCSHYHYRYSLAHSLLAAHITVALHKDYIVQNVHVVRMSLVWWGYNYPPLAPSSACTLLSPCTKTTFFQNVVTMSLVWWGYN